jgi:hypothetical protein
VQVLVVPSHSLPPSSPAPPPPLLCSLPAVGLHATPLRSCEVSPVVFNDLRDGELRLTLPQVRAPPPSQEGGPQDTLTATTRRSLLAHWFYY